jgi:RecA-family ATPase
MTAGKRGASARGDDDDLLSGVRNGAWLDEQSFPPLRYVIPGIVPEGLTVLAGAPKVGKSWIVLSWLLAVASETGRTLGNIALPGARPVFYLALEDGDRRMQDRCEVILAGGATPPTYEYLTEVAPGRLPDTVAAWLALHPDGMVVIDTLGKANSPALRGETTYDRDYRVMSELKSIVDRYPGAALIVNHHDRKASTADFVEAVSGTNAITGSADTVIVLQRDRNQSDGLLNVTGRDVDERAFALQFDAGVWVLEGGSLKISLSAAKERAAETGVGPRSREVIAFVRRYPQGVRPPEVALGLGIDVTAATTYLGRLFSEGRLARPERGLYAPALCLLCC